MANRVRLLLMSVLLAGSVGGTATAQTDPATPPTAAGTSQTLEPGTRRVTLSFRDLGVYGSASLRGVEGSLFLPLGVRLDEAVVGATMRLRYSYSPALLPELSHLRVQLNDQVIAALDLPKEKAGIEVQREVSLDPAYFSDFTQLRLDLIGHYARECEDPSHSSLWAAVSDRSEVELTLRALDLEPDLALLPAPFFDRRDNSRLNLPVVLSAEATLDTLRSAGVAASWFGALASYRSARFPVLQDRLPEQGHALVLATNAQKPAGLALADVAVPTIRVIPVPQRPRSLLLVLQGMDDAQLRQAVEGLVLGQVALTGPQATVTALDLGKPRPAYDAPNWVRTDRPVKLGELVERTEELQARGSAPSPLRVNLRLPPDLLTWNRTGVPIDLRYRYTPPAEAGGSMLTVNLNNQLIKAFPLRPSRVDGDTGNLLIPLLGDGTLAEQGAFVIPAFQLGANNQMQFEFRFDPSGQGRCGNASGDQLRAAVDADSTIDLTGFPHYTEMPNLALYANAGYPFTRYADLAQTAVVLPAQPTPADIEAMLFTLGRMGRVTGVPSLRVQLLSAPAPEQLEDLDVLLIGGGRAGDMLAQWGGDLGVVLSAGARSVANLPAATRFPADPLLPDPQRKSDRKVTLETVGPLATILGFESPLSADRSVVALAATSPERLGALIDAIEDESAVGRIRGDTVILRGMEISSFEGADPYHVGSLRWWMRLWYHLSRHPLLMLLLALGVGVLLAFGLYGYLRRSAEQRLGG